VTVLLRAKMVQGLEIRAFLTLATLMLLQQEMMQILLTMKTMERQITEMIDAVIFCCILVQSFGKLQESRMDSRKLSR
jgi:hypothetical protein